MSSLLLCSSVPEDPGMLKVGDQSSGEELDKEFWIRRAGEVGFCRANDAGMMCFVCCVCVLQLSVQLQQSSDYWSQKVRELSIQLEKRQQFDHRHTDFSD